MTIVTQLIEKELERNQRMVKEYESELLKLPKGKLTVKNVNSRPYYYLKYRSGKKVVTEYVGKDGGKVSKLRSQLDKRRHVEEMLRRLKAEKKELEKLGNMI